jgi:hypothetical protein
LLYDVRNSPAIRTASGLRQSSFFPKGLEGAKSASGFSPFRWKCRNVFISFQNEKHNLGNESSEKRV